MTETPARNPSWRLWAGTGAALFLCFFGLYLAGHSASIYLDDSGETVSDAAVLGVAHPPGYPLHTLLARVATRLPLGGPAEPVTLLAALAGALCVALVYANLLAQTRRETPGFAAALLACALPAALLGLGPVFWHNALTAKGGIYQLNNLLSAALLGLLGLPETSRQQPALDDPHENGGLPGKLSRRRLRAFWLLLGLALAHHYMSQLPLLPAYAWLLWRRARGRLKVSDACLALPGLALYLYLPLRAALNPDLNWGGVHDVSGFLFFFFRAEYASTEVTRSLATSWAELCRALSLLSAEGSFVLLPLAALGAWMGRKESPTQAYALGWLATLAAVCVYLNLGPERLDLMRPYLFPAYLCQALLASRALLALVRARLAAWLRRLALGAAAVACLALAATRGLSLDLSDYYFALDNAHGLLDSLPPKALLLCEGDAVIFPIWYTQRTLHERDDVATVGLDVLPMQWVRDDLKRRWPDVQEPVPTHPLGAESVPALTEETLALNAQRPLYADFDRFGPKVVGWTLASRGPDFLCVPQAFGPPTAVTQSAAQRQAAWLRLESVPIRGFTRRPLDKETLKYMVGDLCVRYNELGVESENAGDAALARDAYQMATWLKPEDPVYAFNLGNAYAELKDPASAALAYERSTRADPDYVNAWFNLGVVQLQMARVHDALASLQEAHRLAPERADIVQAIRQSGGNLLGM